MAGNGNDSTETAGRRTDEDDLVGVSALARAIGIGKSTISKHAAAGKLPVADRDAKGAPLFDIAQVKAHYGDNLNELMRRTPAPAMAASGGTQGELAGPPRPAPTERAPSELQQAAVTEKQLKGRKLLGDLFERERLVVLAREVELEQTTMARRTRDAVTNGMADKASAAYAFAGTPRTEAEWRVWLAERVRETFNTFEATLALENDDEFDDDQSVDRIAGDAVAEGGP